MNKKSILDYSKCTQIANQCTCMHVRKASRAVTQYFDRILSGCGLTNSQFTILVAFALMGKPTLTQMSESLGMDRTTLSRNLKPLLEAGLVEEVNGPDKRARQVMLSESGKNALIKGIPLWEEAQESFIQRMGQPNWKELLKKLSATVVVASTL
jgi:DNA-binding MarR family transcriptional regulator